MMNEWSNSHYTFENGDGTRYTMHLMPHVHGGTIVCVNDSSMWLAFDDEGPICEVKFLCGNNNKYTKKAVEDIMSHHWGRVAKAALEGSS